MKGHSALEDELKVLKQNVKAIENKRDALAEAARDSVAPTAAEALILNRWMVSLAQTFDVRLGQYRAQLVERLEKLRSKYAVTFMDICTSGDQLRALNMRLVNDLVSTETEPPWESKPLRDLATVVSGGTPSRAVDTFWGGRIPWVTPSDITSQDGPALRFTAERITELGLRASSAKLVSAGTVLMTSRATVGEAKVALFDVCTNQGFKSLVPKFGTNSYYLLYQMAYRKAKYANFGIGTTFLEVNKRDTERFEIPVPPREEDQNRIATVLRSIDEQLQTARMAVEKLSALKDGLMQTLLTGKKKPGGSP